MPVAPDLPAAGPPDSGRSAQRGMPSPGRAAPLQAVGTPAETISSQIDFHRRWGFLQDVHVRALAWLLDAPGLLDPLAPQWHGKVATLDVDRDAVGAWLVALDCNAAPLHAYLGMASVTRLGRYAERLMAFYFEWTGSLVAHGLQVRAAANDTIGEFDFLVREDAALVHYEFATKFYLFEPSPSPRSADNFVGPNLADTFDAKMDKILNRQLALGRHPAAQACLPQPVTRAQALVMGWLFYPGRAMAAPDALMNPDASMAPGVSPTHCRGFWCSMTEFCDQAQDTDATANGAGFMVLPRLAWLAPAQVDARMVLEHGAMRQQLRAHFAVQAMPVMLAVMRRASQKWPRADLNEAVGQADQAREVARGFIVPDDWRERALERHQRTVLRLDRS